MDISDSSSSASAQTGAAVSLAVQKMTLDAMKAQGAQLSGMLAPRGGVNSPSQGTNVDAWA